MLLSTQRLLSFLLYVSFIISCVSLSDTLFTHQYSELISESKISSQCSWNCQCPELERENVCICEKQASNANDSESYTLESPYAALLIQIDCPSLISKQPFSLEETLFMNLTSLYDTVQDNSPKDIKIDPEAPIVQIFQLMPKVFDVRYVWCQPNN